MWNNNVAQTCKESSTILYIYLFLHFYEWSIFNEYKTIVYFINFCIFLFPKFLFKISDDLHDYIQWPYTFLQYSFCNIRREWHSKYGLPSICLFFHILGVKFNP